MSIWCTGSVSRMCTGYGIRGWRGRTGQTVIPFTVQHSAYWPGTNLTDCMLCWWCWCISSNIGHARLMLVLSFISCPGISMYCPPSISSFLIHLPPAHLEVADSRGQIKTIRQWMHKILSRRGPSLVHPILDIWTTFVPAKMVHISKKSIKVAHLWGENGFQKNI